MILNAIVSDGTTGLAPIFMLFRELNLKICHLLCCFSLLVRKVLSNLSRHKCKHFPSKIE